MEGENGMGNIQISDELFLWLAQYHLFGHMEWEAKINKGISDKLDAITRRITFSDYKRAVSEDEREKALAKYLQVRERSRRDYCR